MYYFPFTTDEIDSELTDSHLCQRMFLRTDTLSSWYYLIWYVHTNHCSNLYACIQSKTGGDTLWPCNIDHNWNRSDVRHHTNKDKVCVRNRNVQYPVRRLHQALTALTRSDLNCLDCHFDINYE